MTTGLRTNIAIGSFLAFSFLAGCAQADSATPTNKQEVEKIVREYILKNPEIIEQALMELEKKRDKQSILAVKDELWNDKRDFSIGPKNAKVTIVEFFDYNCSFCKTSAGWLQKVINNHPKDVRVIFKELPILERRTKTSRNAAKAALAAKKQGKYMEMHFALMAGTDLNPDYINAQAKKLGLDMEKFKQDMKSEAFDAQLDDAIFLAQRIPNLTGTPFFVINTDSMASGDTIALQKMLDRNLQSAE